MSSYSFAAICAVAESISYEGVLPYNIKKESPMLILEIKRGCYSIAAPNDEILLAEAGSILALYGEICLEPIGESAFAGMAIYGAAEEAWRRAFPAVLRTRSACPKIHALLNQVNYTAEHLPAKDLRSEESVASLSANAYYLLCQLATVDNSENCLSPCVEAAISAMNERYSSLQGIEEICDELEIDKSYFIRRFRRETGYTPGQYLLQIKLGHVKGLVTRRGFSLDVIATLCGFSCANYLSKVFKKATGETVSEYRERNITSIIFDSEEKSNINEIYLL